MEGERERENEKKRKKKSHKRGSGEGDLKEHQKHTQKIELGVSEGEKEEGEEALQKEISTVGSHLLATVGSKIILFLFWNNFLNPIYKPTTPFLAHRDLKISPNLPLLKQPSDKIPKIY